MTMAAPPLGNGVHPADFPCNQNSMVALAPLPLPAGIRSRMAPGINGLDMHFFEAGEDGKPLLLLLHGFPELAYSWRKVMLPLAEAGYRVVAPDQRGYGRTTGWDGDYDGDLARYRILNLVRDAMGLVKHLGHRTVECVIGHDFGVQVAAWSALLRPDLFKSVAIMSAPFAGPPPLGPRRDDRIHAALAALPRPRKHYQWYYATRKANPNMWRAKQGLPAFLRGYYHHKSADWKDNKPFPLKGWTADELAKMPTYYIMDLADGMAETVAREMPAGPASWLTEAELAVYAGEYERTGFQGGLQWYRIRVEAVQTAELEIFAGRTIDVPACFIAGASDWGIHQSPGALERMPRTGFSRMRDIHLIPGAGHWVQQEQPEEVTRRLLAFLAARAA
jgi:pimeloyl-ACP methyl ester carboxylesterase